MDYGWGQIVISGSFSELTKFHNWFITHARNNTSQEFELHAESMSFETDKQYAWDFIDQDNHQCLCGFPAYFTAPIQYVRRVYDVK